MSLTFSTQNQRSDRTGVGEKISPASQRIEPKKGERVSKIVTVLTMMLMSSLTADCEMAMEKAVRVCMSYAEKNHGYKACVTAEHNVTKVCGPWKG